MGYLSSFVLSYSQIGSDLSTKTEVWQSSTAKAASPRIQSRESNLLARWRAGSLTDAASMRCPPQSSMNCLYATRACNDPAEPAHLMPLMQRHQRLSSCAAPSEASGIVKTSPITDNAAG